MLDVPAGKGLGSSLFFSSSTAADGCGSSRFRLFCIFSINDKFRASNRLRKIDEFVLNLMLLERHVTTPRTVFKHCITHRRVISDFQNQLSFRRSPLYTIPCLHSRYQNRGIILRDWTHLIRRFCIQLLCRILELLPGMEVDHCSSRPTGYRGWCRITARFRPDVMFRGQCSVTYLLPAFLRIPQRLITTTSTIKSLYLRNDRSQSKT